MIGTNCQNRSDLQNNRILIMKGVLDSIKLQMLRRADYLRERNVLRESHVHSYETQSARENGWELGGRYSALLSTRNSMESKTSFINKYSVVLQFHLTTLLRISDYMRCSKLLTSEVHKLHKKLLVNNFFYQNSVILQHFVYNFVYLNYYH